jgi:hypothetical protein
MSDRHLHAVLHHVRKLAAAPAANPPSDQDLLDRFVARRDEAARQVGWGLGTLRGRLERGRGLLRVRLRRRGLDLSALLMPTALSKHAAPVGVSPALVASTIQVATSVGAGGGSVQLASAQVAALVTGVLKAMSIARFRVVELVLLAAGGIIACAGVIAYHALAVRQPGPSGQGPAQVAGDRQPDAGSGQPSPPGSAPQPGPPRSGLADSLPRTSVQARVTERTTMRRRVQVVPKGQCVGPAMQ